MMKISVIIPSYNSSATIEQCLQSVLGQDTSEKFEVIVVDSSSDGSDKFVAERFPGIRLIHKKKKMIPSEARNLGAAAAEGEILAFTDADCMPERNWLRRLVDNFSLGYQIVGGSVENGRPESFISQAEYYIEFREFSSSSPKREVRFLPSCNLSIRKSTFESAGGFPQVRASEDVLFAYKLTDLGLKIAFDPEARVKHLNRNKWGPYLENQYVLGKHAAMVRKVRPMPGSSFTRVPYAFPLLPLVRTVKTLQYILQNSFKQAVSQLFQFLIIYPIFFAGTFAWSLGFFHQLRSSDSDDALSSVLRKESLPNHGAGSFVASETSKDFDTKLCQQRL